MYMYIYYLSLFLLPVLEGITSLLVRGRAVLLTEALREAGSTLMGDHAHLWPLTKVLDIGGVAKSPRLTKPPGE